MMAQGNYLFDDDRPPAQPSSRANTSRTAKPVAKKTKPRTDPTAKLPDVLTVTQLTRLIDLALNEHLPTKLILEAETSNCNSHSSGHLYLTLKDDNAQIGAVMWKSAVMKLKFKPTDGMAVVATGRVGVYAPHGKYQFYIDKLEPAGLGALELAFRQLAEKLRLEGLFDDKHKKTIPAYPATIAIVTSATGAAIRDISKTLTRRFGIVRQLLYPTDVQGPNAAPQIAAAIADLNRRREQLGRIDVMIVGRGGGSIEDLWAFNEEIVARAIFASAIPVISAVGHETDTTIADFVADCRAATPTAAAELAVPVLTEVLAQLSQYQQRLQLGSAHRTDTATAALDTLARRPIFTRPVDLLARHRQFLDEKTATLAHIVAELRHHAAGVLDHYANSLAQIEPHVALAGARARINEQHHLLTAAIKQQYRDQHALLQHLAIQLQAATPRRRTEQLNTALNHLAHRTAQAQQQFMWRTAQQLTACNNRLKNLNPRAVLGRGYSITRHQPTNTIVTAATPLAPDDLLVTELADETFVTSKVTKPPKPKEDTHD